MTATVRALPSFDYDVSQVETPAFICDVGALRRNLQTLADVQTRAECKVLLALKGFAMWPLAPIVREYLPGITSSSPHEARLGREEFKGEVHACAPAYSEADFDELLTLCDHIVLNSPAQLRQFLPRRDAYATRTGRKVELGLRLNPEHREVEVELYDPCAPRSRLGTTAAAVQRSALTLDGVDGLHFHTLCELGADALERTLAVVEEKFGALLERVRWVNMGGGHHITRPGYDIDRLVSCVRNFADRHGVQVYLEPGEAIALHTGVLVTTVLDIIRNGIDIAILDVSATAHMPDVLEMPYRPVVGGGDAPGTRAFTYRLGGLSCLAGDVIGDWSFDAPLKVGDKLLFDDMIHYTMVKTTTFNGVRLPSIATADPDTKAITVLRRFGYEDYRARLG